MPKQFELIYINDEKRLEHEVFWSQLNRTQRLVELTIKTAQKIDERNHLVIGNPFIKKSTTLVDNLVAELTAHPENMEDICYAFHIEGINSWLHLQESELPEPPQIASEDVLDLHLAIQVTPIPGSTQSLAEAKQELTQTLTQWLTDITAPLFENWGGTKNGIAKAEAEGINYNCDNYPGPFLTQITIYNGTKIIGQSQW